MNVTNILNPLKLDDAQAQVYAQRAGLQCHLLYHYCFYTAAVVAGDAAQVHSIFEYFSLALK